MKKPFEQLRAFALDVPEATESTPWGETAIKVRGKIFLFMRLEGGTLGLTVKLPQSAPFALDEKFTAPAGYGLGKSGWVTATFTGKDRPPVDQLCGWIEESFRAVAPKKLTGRGEKNQEAESVSAHVRGAGAGLGRRSRANK